MTAVLRLSVLSAVVLVVAPALGQVRQIEKYVPQNGGVVGVYPFSEKTQGKDISGLSNHFDLMGGAKIGPSGLLLDGKYGFAEMAQSSPNFDFESDEFAIHVLVTFNKLETEQVIVEKFDGHTGFTVTKMGNGDDGGGTVEGPGGKPDLTAIRFGIVGFGLDAKDTGIQPGKPTRIGIFREGNKFSIWVDEVEKAKGTFGGAVTSNFGPLRVGRRHPNDERHFFLNGHIGSLLISRNPSKTLLEELKKKPTSAK